MLGERCRSHASATCIGVASRREPLSDKRIRLQWSEPAKRKERNIGDAVTSKIRDERIVGPMCQVVLILDADDRVRSAALPQSVRA